MSGVWYNGSAWAASADYSNTTAYCTSVFLIGSTWTFKEPGDPNCFIATDIAYGNSKWVLAADDGVVGSSNGGNTWSLLAPASNALQGIASDGGNKIVAVGYAATVVTYNGSAWSESTPAAAGGKDLTRVAYGTYNTGRWVAVGDNATIMYSDNGTSWTAAASKPAGTQWLRGVTYGNGKYVVVGDNSTIWTSTDGSTWAAQSLGISSLLLAGVAVDNSGHMVAVGNGGKIFVYDGSSWVDESVGSNNLTDVAFGNGQFVAVGDSGTILTRTANFASNNAYLGSLSVSPGSLSFDKNTTAYTVAAVLYSTNSISVTATAEDSKAKSVTINGTAATAGNSHTVAVPLSVGPNSISVVVTAEDDTPKTYTISVTRQSPSSIATLSNLTVSPGTLSSTFASGTFNYGVTVASTVSSIQVTPTKTDAGATLKINGNTAPSGSPTTVSLPTPGDHPITVRVTAEDGTTLQDYTITVHRQSGNATLSNLTVDQGTLVFNGATTNYNLNLNPGTTSLNVTATLYDTVNASLYVDGTLATSGVAYQVSPLPTPGNKTVSVTVYAEDRAVIQNYSIAVHVMSNNANLSGLSLAQSPSGTNIPFNETFAQSTTAYTASVLYGVQNVTVTPTLADSTATVQVKVGSTVYASPYTVPLTNVGDNQIDVVVTPESGAPKTYTITVTRGPASTNADLQALSVSSGTLSPAFPAGTTGYEVSVPNGTTSVQVTPTVADTTATLKVQGITRTSGTAVTITLGAGPTSVPVAVYAEDGSTQKTYTITFWPGPAFTAAPENTGQLRSVGASLYALKATGATGATLIFATSDALPPGITALNSDGTFTGTVSTVGSTTMNITVSDGHGGQASTSLTVNVQAAPDFTSASANTSQSISTGQALAALVVTKAAGETLTFTTSDTMPPGISLNPTTGVFTGLATGAGPYSLTVDVTDTHGGKDTTTLTINVRQGPTFSGATTNTSQLRSMGAGLVALVASVPDSDPLTFSTSDALPPGITALNPDGTFTGITSATGTTTAAIYVTDTQGGLAWTTLTITVQAPPAFTGAPTNTNQVVSVGGTLYALDVTMAAGESLTYAASGLPTGVTLDSAGVFGGQAQILGETATATITISDTHGGQAPTTLNVTVQEAPAFTAATTNISQRTSVGSTLYGLQITKASGETVTFSLYGGTSLPPGILLSTATGTFTGAATTGGAYTTQILAQDAHGGKAVTTLNTYVQQAPAFTGAATNTYQTVSVGAGLYQLLATGDPLDTLTYSTSDPLPPGITPLNPDGTFTGTVTTVGDTTLSVQVSDTHGGQATTSLTIHVQPAPAFTAATANTSQSISTGQGMSPLVVTKAAGETLTFSTSDPMPPGISFNSTTGAFTGTATQAGTYTLHIAVSDTHGGQDSTTLSVTVRQGPVFTAAATNHSQTVSVGAVLYALDATVPPGETLNFTFGSGSLPAGITLNSNGSFASTTSAVGTTTAVLYVTDTQGGTDWTTLTVHVQAPPAFTGATTNTNQVVSVGGTLYALDLTMAAGETLTYSITSGSLPTGVTLSSAGVFGGAATTAGQSTTATITVHDTHSGQASTVLHVTVQPAPAYTAATTNTSQLVSVGRGLDALNVTMAPGETVTFSLYGGATLPAGITLNSDGTFLGTATTTGTTATKIQVADTHGGKAVTTLNVTVQPAPAVPTIINRVVSVGSSPAPLGAVGAPGETLTYTLTGGALPAGITLDSPTGTFTGTVTGLGDTTASIRVDDTHGGRATTTFNVTVQPAPTFTAAVYNTAQTISTGMSLYSLDATAAPGETLTFTLGGGSLPAGITLDSPTGTFGGAATTAGTVTATIYAADTHGGRAATSLVVTVQQGPVFTAAASNKNQSIMTGQQLVPLAVTVDVGQTATFSLLSGNLPAGITLNPNGTFTGTTTTAGTFTPTIQAADARGGKAQTTLTVTVTNPAPPPPPVTPPTPPVTPPTPPVTPPTPPVTPPTPQTPHTTGGVEIIVNGVRQDDSATATTSTDGDQTTTTVTINPQKLDEKLNQEGDGAVVTIPVQTGADVVVGELTGQMVKNMETKQAVIEVQTEAASYSLPAERLKIDTALTQFGDQVDPKDVKVHVRIAAAPTDEVKVVEDSANKGSFAIVVPPLQFSVTVTHQDKTVEVSKFDAYVERTVAIPDGVDPNKITTGIVVDPDGTVRHVPTKVIIINGRYYAKINSLSNSSYTVIWHPLEFADVADHWSKAIVNEMGSRMVVSGVGDGTFAPDRAITRAEFAAIVVRALGIKPAAYTGTFSDVVANDWFASSVAAAYEYGIIKGYDDGTFRPGNTITRQEAMAMVARAMKIAGMDVQLSADAVGANLALFIDAAQFADWARTSAALVAKYGVMVGHDGLAKPTDNITRAETATIIMRMLQKAGLI